MGSEFLEDRGPPSCWELRCAGKLGGGFRGAHLLSALRTASVPQLSLWNPFLDSGILSVTHSIQGCLLSVQAWAHSAGQFLQLVLALWELSVLWRKDGRINVHVKGTQCASLSVEWSGSAARQAMPSCVWRRVGDLRTRTAPAVFFSPAAKDPHQLSRMQS